MEMKYSDLSALQKLCAASGASNTSDIARVILSGNFRRVFLQTRLPGVYSAHFSAPCRNIDHSKNLLFSRRDSNVISISASASLFEVYSRND